MKNENIHRALCELFPDAPEGSWKLSQGPETNWEVTITEWNLSDPVPSQENLDEVYAQFELLEFQAIVNKKLSEILDKSDIALSPLTSKYSKHEKLSWPKQEAEALAYDKDPLADTPFLSELAQSRGISLEELVLKVLKNIEIYSKVSSNILGQQQHFEDVLRTATTIEEVAAIVVVYVYPEL